MSDEYKNAKFYDAFLYLFVRKIRLKILELVQKYNYSNILDVCCGTGNQLKLLKKHGINGVGIDISFPMLKIARSGKHKIECYEQDAENIQYSDNYFELTTTTFALHEKSYDTAKQILAEMLRVTKVNGHLILTDFSITDNTFSIGKKTVGFIESLAGDEHFLNYQNYLLQGGLVKLISDIPIKIIEEHNFGLNSVTIKVLEKTK